MPISVKGSKVTVHAVRPLVAGQKSEDPKLPGVVDAGLLSNQRLIQHLCSAGPVNCAKCRLCTYGKEYVRREEKKKMARPVESKDVQWEANCTLRTGDRFLIVGTMDELIEKLEEMKDSLKRISMKAMK